MCLSLPCVVGDQGIEEILTLNLSSDEEAGFRKSGERLQSTLRQLGVPGDGRTDAKAAPGASGNA
jgi:malate/lactate dehydrogenase